MMHYSLIFLVIAIFAAVLGFTGLVAGVLVSIAKFLFLISLVVWIITFFSRSRSPN